MVPTEISPFQVRLAEREAQHNIVSADQLVTPQDRTAQYFRFHQMVGGTPLLRLPLDNGGTAWAKFEMDSPTENHYDRASLAMFELLEGKGLIKPGDTILEGTSGSAGRSVAYFARRLGFNLQMLVPQEMDPVRRMEIEAQGATVLTAKEPGGIGSVVKEYGERIMGFIDEGYDRVRFREDGAKVNIFNKDGEVVCASNHSESLFTPKAFGQIAREVAIQLPYGVRIDTYLGTLGNGSSMKGISEELRRIYGEVKTIGVETLVAPVHALRKYGPEWFQERYGFVPAPEIDGVTQVHDVPGESVWGYVPPFIELNQIDEIRIPDDASWRELQKEYNDVAWKAHHSTNYIGRTSAQNLYLAEQVAEESPGRNILIVFFDRADQYSDWPPKSYRTPYPPFEDMLDYARSYKTRLIPGVKVA